jgi:hypothetical protein
MLEFALRRDGVLDEVEMEVKQMEEDWTRKRDQIDRGV